MKVQYKLQKRENDEFPPAQWKFGLPFFLNPRGLLVHRVKSARTHRNQHSGRAKHESVGYWCGNQTCTHGGEGFTDDPSTDYLLCAVCEAKAVADGLPSADALLGRHAHIGHLRPVRDCCKNEGN